MKAVFTATYQVNLSAPPVVPTHTVSNFAEGGDAIMVKRDDPSVKTKVGMDGRGSIMVTSKRSGTITLKLLQTSPSNKVLASILSLIEGGPLTFAPVFIQFVDLYRQDAAIGTYGVITKWPDISRGDDIAEQEWEIWAPRLDLVLGDPLFAGLGVAAAEASF